MSNFTTEYRKITKHQIAWKYVRWKPSCSMWTDRQTKGQRDMTKPMAAFRNSVNAPNKIPLISPNLQYRISLKPESIRKNNNSVYPQNVFDVSDWYTNTDGARSVHALNGQLSGSSPHTPTPSSDPHGQKSDAVRLELLPCHSTGVWHCIIRPRLFTQRFHTYGTLCSSTQSYITSLHFLNMHFNIIFSRYLNVILPVLLCGCETWLFILREGRRLRVFENRVLRRIFGSTTEEVIGEWKKQHNEGCNDLYCSSNIVRVIKSRRMRWEGHVACMGERGGYTDFWWGNLSEWDHSEDPCIDGQIILRWIFRKWDGGYGLYLVQDRDRWRAVVNAVIKLRVP